MSQWGNSARELPLRSASVQSPSPSDTVPNRRTESIPRREGELHVLVLVPDGGVVKLLLLVIQPHGTGAVKGRMSGTLHLWHMETV
jgi:hypothetical protein